MNQSLPAGDDARLQFAQLAVQYYVAGRAASIHQLIPVLGNLLHHAVEMSLKAALATQLSMPQIRKLGHNLPNLWDSFVGSFRYQAPPHLRPIVEGLQSFEELRYPESIMKKGAMMQLALFREHVGDSTPGPANVPTYLLVLEDVDDLMATLFNVMNLNPKFFTGALSETGRQHLELHNRFASQW